MKHWKDRNGVWVETDQGVGIRLVDPKEIRTADGAVVGRIDVPMIHLTDADGVTMVEVPESAVGNVRIARRASIPAQRIAGFSDEQLARLGYA